MGFSFAELDYSNPNQYVSKVCAYLWGPESYEVQGCGTMFGHAYTETWRNPAQWDTRLGLGLRGYIKTLYIWGLYKSLTHMYFTPRRNDEYRRLDRCTPFSMMGSPTCSACDQYKGVSTCFTACNTNTYETFWSSNQCQAYN